MGTSCKQNHMTGYICHHFIDFLYNVRIFALIADNKSICFAFNVVGAINSKKVSVFDPFSLGVSASFIWKWLHGSCFFSLSMNYLMA